MDENFLEPGSEPSPSSKASWRFEAAEDRVSFEIKVSGSISLEFAKKVLHDAVARKNKAVISGDGISLDMLVGGLTKEAVNDFGRVVKLASEGGIRGDD